MIKESGWRIEVQDLYCLMHPKKHPEITLMAKLRCNEYPARAPSLQFVDPVSRREGAEFWPKQGDVFKAALTRPGIQLCIPGIREYHEGCHSGANDPNPWNPEKFTFANILERVQLLLDDSYP